MMMNQSKIDYLLSIIGREDPNTIILNPSFHLRDHVELRDVRGLKKSIQWLFDLIYSDLITLLFNTCFAVGVLSP